MLLGRSARDIVLLVSFTILAEDEVGEVEDRIKYKHTKYTTIVNRGNGYQTRQSSLFYVFVLFLGLNSAQNTIVVYSVPHA